MASRSVFGGGRRLLQRWFARSKVAPDAFDRIGERVAAEFARHKVFLVVGPARSGTIRTLGLASNVEAFSEPLPRFGVDVRRHQLGLLEDPIPLIWRNRIERIREVTAKGKIYGEKDQQVYCWLPYYRRLFNPRIVLVRRDGRDSVRSLCNQHYEALGNLYREVDDADSLSPQACENALALPPPVDDPIDMMRQRPTAEDPAYYDWSRMTRFEMVAWYWSAYVRIVQRDLYNMENERWSTFDFATQNNPDAFARLYGFLGLEGFDRAAVEAKLASRPGALAHQVERASGQFPRWEKWSPELARSFDRYAASAMVQCGYYGVERLPLCEGAKPADTPLHFERDPLVEGVAASIVKEVVPGLNCDGSVLVIGEPVCGLTGPNVTHWNGSRLNELPETQFDLVVAVGVIDQAPDMDAFLIQLARRARCAILVAARWGHSDQLVEHQYRWAENGRGEHRWCVAKARSLLRYALGFAHADSKGFPTRDHARPRVSLLVGTRG